MQKKTVMAKWAWPQSHMEKDGDLQEMPEDAGVWPLGEAW